MYTIRTNYEKAFEALEFCKNNSQNKLFSISVMQQLSGLLIEMNETVKSELIAQESVQLTNEIITDDYNYLKSKAMVCLSKSFIALKQLEDAEVIVS